MSYILIGIIETRRSPILISPLSVYFLWYSVKYGFAAIYMSGVIADKGYTLFAGFIESGSLLVTGYIITLVGSLAFHAGLQMLRPSIHPENAKPIKWSVPLESLIVLWIIGSTFLYRPTIFSFLGAASGVLTLAPLAALLVLATLPASAFWLSEVAYWSLLILGTFGLVAVSLGAWYGSKETVMLSLVPLFAAAIIRPRLRKYVPIAAVSVVLIYLLSVAPVINKSRIMPGQAEMTPSQRFIVAFKKYSPLYTGDFQVRFLKRQEDNFFNRVFEPSAVGFIAGLVKTSGLKYGATMSNLIYGFIPRFIWPEKPDVTLGSWFTRQLGLRGQRTSTGMFAAGELYWNFGWLGVIAGMWLLGVLTSELWRMAGRDPRGKLLQMWLFVCILYPLVEIAEASSYLVGIVYSFIFFGTLIAVNRVAREVARRETFLRKVPVSYNARQSASSTYPGRE